MNGRYLCIFILFWIAIEGYVIGKPIFSLLDEKGKCNSVTFHMRYLRWGRIWGGSFFPLGKPFIVRM